MLIEFTVDIVPIAKGRPRFARRGRFVHTFTPMKTRSFENILIEKATKFKPLTPIDGDIRVGVIFGMPIPASRMPKFDLNARNPHTIKPDIDNLLKGVLDPLNGVFWNDDAQISQITASKVYSKYPSVEVTIEWGDCLLQS
jgi:Holliday junction resolvase RusA-like endonuclease